MVKKEGADMTLEEAIELAKKGEMYIHHKPDPAMDQSVRSFSEYLRTYKVENKNEQ